MFFLKNTFLIAIFLISNSVYSVTTFYASALVDATQLMLTDPTGTIVILDVNLMITQSAPLLLVGNAGNLAFTATENQQLIIAQGVQWNISSLQKPHALNFTGNAQLVMQPGAQLLADQVTGVNINFQDQTIMSVVS